VAAFSWGKQMHTIILKKGRKIIERRTFATEREAWAFLDDNAHHYECEYVNEAALKAFRRG
jgi:hypothetical protein